ncbi:MAG TPA: hypothetical protein VFS40_05385 [Gemmatimonadales bacterium]|nr:hypothetical protein [Gemmatimonadales bacterium]
MTHRGTAVVAGACVALAGAACHRGAPEPAPAPNAATATDLTPGAAPVCATSTLAPGKRARPYASLPFQSALAPAELYAAVRARLRDEGFTLCGERPEQGVLATEGKKLQAPGSDTKRRVAVALFLTAARGGSQGQLWVVSQDDAPRTTAERRAAERELRAMAEALREKVVGR